MISFENVGKRHGSRSRGSVQALADVSFTAQPGRVTGFVGPNGAGKSSALRILLGLDRADTGTATIDGHRYRDLDRPLTRVGSMLDGAGAHPWRTARAHLAWVAASNGISRCRIPQVLEQTGLTDAARRRVGTFSLGMGQRLGLATALLGDPPVLVLDEPVNGLDPAGVRWIRELLRARAQAGGTVLLSSHLMGELASVADDIVVIAGGRIAASGPLGQISVGHRDLESAYFALTGDAR